MTKTNLNTGNPLTKRYPPNNRFIAGDFNKQVEVHIRIDNFGESVVDKESYRLSLTSKRGAIGNGYSNVGQYMFNDGKYDPTLDFSYVMRKDLSIVEIDRYIESRKAELEKADEALKASIEKQIANAEKLKADKQSKTSSESSSETNAE